jgi:hypothetical protein
LRVAREQPRSGGNDNSPLYGAAIGTLLDSLSAAPSVATAARFAEV